MTKKELAIYLTGRINKEEVLNTMKLHPALVPDLVGFSLLNEQPLAWRATWIMRQTISENSLLLVDVIPEVIQRLPTMAASHQREWLKALNHQIISDDDLGLLFEVCVDFWLGINNHAALRSTAFDWLMFVASKFPDLKSEVEMLMQQEYLDLLTPGIKKGLLNRAFKQGYNPQ